MAKSLTLTVDGQPVTEKPQYAGLVQYRRARATGTHVGVYNGEQANLDTDGGENPWSTVCEEHGGVCSHPTKTLALQYAPHPEIWCPVCQGTDEAE